MLVTGASHTDFVDQAKFMALKPDEQLLQIWLNGRETNGSVADAIRDIEVVRAQASVHDARLGKLELRYAVAGGVLAAILIAAPFLFWGLDRLIN